MAEWQDTTRYLGNMQNHQKMYDFARDILRVKNPLNSDFTFIYDQIPYTVPANGTKDMERYLVHKYIADIMGHIYNQLTEARFEKAQEAFQRTHPDVIDDPYLMNEKIWLKLPRADNPEFQTKIIKDCIIGVVSKFGTNRIVANKPQNGQLDPNTPLYSQLINDFKTVVPGEMDAISKPLEASEPLPTAPASISEVTL